MSSAWSFPPTCQYLPTVERSNADVQIRAICIEILSWVLVALLPFAVTPRNLILDLCEVKKEQIFFLGRV